MFQLFIINLITPVKLTQLKSSSTFPSKYVFSDVSSRQLSCAEQKLLEKIY